jgi:hypothetical protein
MGKIKELFGGVLTDGTQPRLKRHSYFRRKYCWVLVDPYVSELQDVNAGSRSPSVGPWSISSVELTTMRHARTHARVQSLLRLLVISITSNSKKEREYFGFTDKQRPSRLITLPS